MLLGLENLTCQAPRNELLYVLRYPQTTVDSEKYTVHSNPQLQRIANKKNIFDMELQPTEILGRRKILLPLLYWQI